MQAFAASLDVTFLASPAGIEAFVALFGREGAELFELALGKKAAGDVFPIFHGADELDVDAPAAIGREGKQREAARVRHVEMDGRIAGSWSRICLREAGFAAFGVVKPDFVGRSGEVLAEELAEDSARGDVGVAIAMEGKAVGSGMLVGGECGFPGDWREALGIVSEAPDVDLARCEALERLRGA